MTLVSRRTFVAGSAAGAAVVGTVAAASKTTLPALKSMTSSAQPISAEEHQARL
jgi:hypothetical protein